jgi:2-keto-4-pentenoate hydratase/2-oxohepta-3-ene-1,7-dioic acid hydratase in catechol pathway
MRLATVDDRLCILVDDRATDVERASDGRFPSTAEAALQHWEDLVEWGQSRTVDDALPLGAQRVGPPISRPTQVFAVGLNYRSHAAETGHSAPDSPPVFTKFVTCLAGPRDTVTLPSPNVDWEVELVVVIGRAAEKVSESDAWNHVAGLTVGQDLSERSVQLAGPVPQFSLAKSFPGFGPLGPSIVTLDEIATPDDLELSCRLDGELLQKGRTSDMIFSVPELIARLSAICPLLPGDVIFTGTPAGVGLARKPRRFLTPGSTLVSSIEGIGELSNPLIAGPEYEARKRLDD